ncbi:Mercuric resistance operon regulatory protein [Euzebya pacifica]|mgnify:FL=1|uniref:Mercuric resistance operon regulatory protein n=1 Tax=Euzebya pacifica TaxID=1608957 RepID=A0A346XY65_9ACTN|nr:MerR family transcriptional regulator [Euzebya pacifica]AXV07162.1 Mercuric resistance operon regulatory protein [Euzebya pacifica]
MLIGALANATGVPAKTLRQWEAERLLNEPARTTGAYRDYADDIIDIIAFICHAQTAGLTLRQIKEVIAIRDDSRAPCRHAADLLGERLTDIDTRLRELEQTRTALDSLRRRLDALDPAECDPSVICSAMSPSAD